MKKLLVIFLAALLIFSGCATCEKPPVSDLTPTQAQPVRENETLIELSDEGIKTKALSVFATNDIIYYEDRDFYESGNPYGEGGEADKHTAEEASAHTVVNITEPGTYRVTGKLSAGQIRVDLGEDAYEDENAVVELILDNADITCTVAPAILFLNVYECDGDRDKDNARPDVDTASAGANLILEGENKVRGSYVARIYKDKEGEKKLWKQDGAIYSYMSMNVSGSGALELTAENEGMDTELHLTINGGDIVIRSGNDGINTNEDDVSVTTINDGNIHILAGLGAEGDGIDSNGYLVINGGKVFAAAHPASDAGLDSDCGSYIHGGTVIALGSVMDWAESDSNQVTMNLQFASYRDPADAILIIKEDGAEVFTYDPAADAVVGENARQYMGAIISCSDFRQGDTYLVYVNGTQMQYTGTDVMRRPGGFGGDMPDNAPPEGFVGRRPVGFDGQKPADMDLPEGFGKIPSREDPEMGEGFDGQLPEGFDGQPPEGFNGRKPDGFGGDRGGVQPGGGNTAFFMQDKVNFFSGLTAAAE